MDRIRKYEGDSRARAVEHSESTKEIIGAAYAVYNETGFGFPESVYESCMVVELTDRGMTRANAGSRLKSVIAG